MTVPQKAADGIPATQKASPASAPCTMPMRNVPFTIARVTETKRSSMRRSSSSDSGR